MKKISSIELIALNGGSASERDYMWYLQYEANLHQHSGNQEMENDYWDEWATRFEECAGV